MASSKAMTWGLITLVVILALIVGGIIGFRIAGGILTDKVVQALGPGSEVMGIQATVRNVAIPSLRGQSPLGLDAVVKGIQQDGRAKIVGWVEAATKESWLKTGLRSVDLVALQPYTQISSGTNSVEYSAHSAKSVAGYQVGYQSS